MKQTPSAYLNIYRPATPVMVAWVERLAGKDTDHYKVFLPSDYVDHFEEAEKFYDVVVQQEITYSANLTLIIKSTDYDVD